jgi:hypothetical protein
MTGELGQDSPRNKFALITDRELRSKAGDQEGDGLDQHEIVRAKQTQPTEDADVGVRDPHVQEAARERGESVIVISMWIGKIGESWEMTRSSQSLDDSEG